MANAALMEETMTFGPPESYWQQLASASSRLLMLDYDGTLAPFNVNRMEARPSSSTLLSLKRLLESGGTRVVIVSGRPAEQVAELLGHLPVTIVGAHGFERFEYMAGTVRSTLTNEESEGLAAAQAAAQATGMGSRIEAKPASVAVHTRGLDTDEARDIEELAWNLWSPVAEQFGLECRPFSCGVEIRSRHYHKGIAVETLLAEMPDQVFATYIGDDQTDEDAFRALAGRGSSFRVGEAAVESEATWRLENVDSVQNFLDQWHKHAEGGTPGSVQVKSSTRLVVISNRLPSFSAPRAFGKGREKAAGGLASAVTAALKHTGDGMWVGWSGKTRRRSEARQLREIARDPVPVLGMDLSEREVEAYYNGFCNHALWPLLHSFQAQVSLSTWELEVYRDVNLSFAQLLRPMLKEGDLAWVHDYHLIHLGDELRRLNFRGLIGFFLHVPFPSLDFLAILPDYKSFVEALSQYDLVGFHTQSYRDNYVYACRRVLNAEWDGEILTCGDRKQRVGVFPAGIDPERFAPVEKKGSPRARSGRAGDDEPQLIIGVDRLDYTKGIPERILAFERLLKMRPDLRRKISLLQICAPSRTRVKEYVEQKERMDALVGRLNAELGEHDWEPIRYVYRSYPQSQLGGLYRKARVGLVTPLRDGMNLVAKEYVAAQNPEDPGVLVLSRFAGAAEELTEALIINPYLPESCAGGIAEALQMPLPERIRRHRAMLDNVETHTASRWAEKFLSELKRCADIRE